MARRIAEFGWETTPLGPLSSWPAGLRSIVALVVHSPLPLAMLWGEAGIVLPNDAYLALTGDDDRLLGRSLREAWPDAGDLCDEIIAACRSGAALSRRDHPLRCRHDGVAVDTRLNLDCSPFHGEDGRPAGAVLSLTGGAAASPDAEPATAALQRNQTQFQLLVQGVTDYAIYMLDHTGRIISWNAGAERIKGYRPEEILGHHFSTFYLEEDRARGDPDRALQTARTDGRFAAEGWRVRKDGTRFRASVVIDAIHDDAGDLIGFAKITRDITEREEVQRQLELAREALFQSQKMEAIGQLTGGVAHDFNNLLMAILSSLELLRKRIGDDPQVKRLLENSVKAAERGAALTQRMLAFARRQELTTEQVAIPQMVAGMMELLRGSLGPTFTIETSFPLGLDLVLTDVNQLEMALLNLAVNARDAMPNGGVITVGAIARDVGPGEIPDLAPGRYVRLSIRDGGVGMEPDVLARAADPFFTTKGVGKGTGLGLSMVHGFARQLGGALMLESAPGEGTTAHIWLPAGAPLAPAPATQEAEMEAEPDRPLTVLLVDDDALILMNTAALLEDLGHRVIEANSGAEALDLFRANPGIDLLITDQAMPAMTGSELIATVRGARPDLPIVLATGYGEMPDEMSGAVHRLGKPFNQNDLRRAVLAAAG